MGRVLGIDYGKKRCGIAVTDTLQIAVHPLDLLATDQLLEFLTKYIEQEEVDYLVFGRPTHADGNPTPLVNDIDQFIKKLHAEVGAIRVEFQDESYTSLEASQILVMTNKKKNRRNKSKLDILSAVLILQRYLQHI